VIALFLGIVSGAAYLALDCMVWKGGLPDLIQFNGRIEGDHMTIAGKFPGRVQELLAREGTTVQSVQV
jgi:HlyD family secretion protein